MKEILYCKYSCMFTLDLSSGTTWNTMIQESMQTLEVESFLGEDFSWSSVVQVVQKSCKVILSLKFCWRKILVSQTSIEVPCLLVIFLLNAFHFFSSLWEEKTESLELAIMSTLENVKSHFYILRVISTSFIIWFDLWDTNGMEGTEFVIGNHYMIKAQVQCAKILISSPWFFFLAENESRAGCYFVETLYKRIKVCGNCLSSNFSYKGTMCQLKRPNQLRYFCVYMRDFEGLRREKDICSNASDLPWKYGK